MEKVFVLTDGVYSDYHIIGIFSTRKKAEEMLNEMYHKSDVRISEFELNPFQKQLQEGLKKYVVSMKRNGDIEEEIRRDITNTYYEDTGNQWGRIYTKEIANAPIEGYKYTFITSVWAKDEKHAVKIVNEKRMILIAEGEWEAPPKEAIHIHEDKNTLMGLYQIMNEITLQKTKLKASTLGIYKEERIQKIHTLLEKLKSQTETLKAETHKVKWKETCERIKKEWS